MSFVFNARGGTASVPCPTAVSRWFSEGYCSAEDYEMWRRAAVNLYEFGLLPLYRHLDQTPEADSQTRERIHNRIEQYAAKYNALPKHGSVLSAARNLELVSEAVALMTFGDQTVEQLRLAIGESGSMVPDLAIPGPPTEPLRKPAWGRFVFPVAIVGGTGLVLVLTLAASNRSTTARPGGIDG